MTDFGKVSEGIARRATPAHEMNEFWLRVFRRVARCRRIVATAVHSSGSGITGQRHHRDRAFSKSSGLNEWSASCADSVHRWTRELERKDLERALTGP